MGVLLVQGHGLRPLLASERRRFPTSEVEVPDAVEKSLTHGRTADQPDSGEEPARKAARGDSWCWVRELKEKPYVPRLRAPQRLEVTCQPTRFLPRLPQVQGATSNLNFARPECKSESRPQPATRSEATPHPLTVGAGRGSPLARTWPRAPQLRALGLAEIKWALSLSKSFSS